MTDHRMEYQALETGEYFKGTAEQLRAYGICLSDAFPTGPNKCDKKFIDPRGFPGLLRWFPDDGIYRAWIRYPHFPMKPEPPYDTTQFAPGVRLETWPCMDYYYGRGEALVAAGLVDSRHLPGQPGMRRVCVTIYADGTLPTGRGTCSSLANMPGAVSISRRGTKSFELGIRITHEAYADRQRVQKARMQEWELAVAALPRPTPLRVIRREVPSTEWLGRPVSPNALAPFAVHDAVPGRALGERFERFMASAFGLGGGLREGPRRPDATA